MPPPRRAIAAAAWRSDDRRDCRTSARRSGARNIGRAGRRSAGGSSEHIIGRGRAEQRIATVVGIWRRKSRRAVQPGRCGSSRASASRPRATRADTSAVIAPGWCTAFAKSLNGQRAVARRCKALRTSTRAPRWRAGDCAAEESAHHPVWRDYRCDRSHHGSAQIFELHRQPHIP